MEDLFRALMGGSGPQVPAEQSQGDPLAELLQGLLGGGTPSGLGGQEAMPSDAYGSGAPGLGGLLEAILGGGQASPGYEPVPEPGAAAGGLGDILGAILGGSGSSMASDPFVASLVDLLSSKLGLPPQIGQLVVGFVLSKLLKRRVESGAATAPSAPRPAEEEGMDLDSLLESMGRGRRVSAADVRSTGMAQELAQQTGLDPETAAASLQQVLNALSGQLGSERPPAPQQSGLDSLLDTW